MASRQQRISSGRLDPKSPYIGNFHRGHACTVVEQDDEVVDFQQRRSAMHRSSSEPNVQSMISPADMQELANMELSPDFRNFMPTTSKQSASNDYEHSPADSSKSDSIHQPFSSERASVDNTSINSRLNLDGIPSTPELCALQAILPKQVTMY
jgi:hypothetical protein